MKRAEGNMKGAEGDMMHAEDLVWMEQGVQQTKSLHSWSTTLLTAMPSMDCPGPVLSEAHEAGDHKTGDNPEAELPSAPADDKVLRVVLLGKTGVGKSSTGNTLLHREAFQVGRGLCSGTERCQWADAEVEGITLQVTDTPGLSDTHRSEDEVLREVGKSIAVASPGPHVILVVIRCDARFTAEEYTAYVTLKEMFGPAIKQHMIVVFVGTDTYGDTLDQQRDGLREQMTEPSEPLKEILEGADGRFFGISNKAKGNRSRQAAELIAMMKDLKRQRGGAYFQSEVSAEVNSMVAPLVNNRAARGNMTQADAIRQTNQAIVEEKESPDFFDRLLTTLQSVRPKIEKGLEVAYETLKVAMASAKFISLVRGGCSVM